MKQPPSDEGASQQIFTEFLVNHFLPFWLRAIRREFFVSPFHEGTSKEDYFINCFLFLFESLRLTVEIFSNKRFTAIWKVAGCWLVYRSYSKLIRFVLFESSHWKSGESVQMLLRFEVTDFIVWNLIGFSFTCFHLLLATFRHSTI